MSFYSFYKPILEGLFTKQMSYPMAPPLKDGGSPVYKPKRKKYKKSKGGVKRA